MRCQCDVNPHATGLLKRHRSRFCMCCHAIAKVKLQAWQGSPGPAQCPAPHLHQEKRLKLSTAHPQLNVVPSHLQPCPEAQVLLVDR
jgi:hypothetical protein